MVDSVYTRYKILDFFWTFDDKDFKLALADADDGVRPGAA